MNNLHKSQTWNSNNFTIKSVDLLGATIDDEQVSTNPQDILIDQTNLGTPKSDYGHAIEAEVTNFTNSFSSKDNMLEPNPEKSYYPYQVYPSFETDWHLDRVDIKKLHIISILQNRFQTIIPRMMLKINYHITQMLMVMEYVIS